TLTLKDLIKIAGGCDFLKCDAEGAEWLIRPQDLAGIRRIEMELHFPPIGPPPNPALLEFIADNYLFSLDRLPVHDTLGVMGILHAVLK
ncbi:MAG: FkbM family methyltransferase, partial [Methanoregula sp.]